MIEIKLVVLAGGGEDVVVLPVRHSPLSIAGLVYPLLDAVSALYALVQEWILGWMCMSCLLDLS